MLVEKKKIPSVVAVKLVTGEEIIAQFVSLENGTLKVENPLSMVMAENPDNPAQTRVMFTPWMVAAETVDIEIREQHILTIANARTDATEQYLTAVSK